MNAVSQSNLKQAFNKQAKPLKQRKSAKSTLPVSIRVTAQEKRELQQMAGVKPISSYIRQRLFGDAVAARPKQYLKKQRQPRIDHVEIARLLGMFGKSQLATSMLALSLAVQAGELQVTAEVASQIECACNDIKDIRSSLVMALGMKPQGGYA